MAVCNAKSATDVLKNKGEKTFRQKGGEGQMGKGIVIDGRKKGNWAN